MSANWELNYLTLMICVRLQMKILNSEKEFAEAENIIDEEFSLLKESFKLIGVEDIIANLRVSMENIRERETEKAIAKLSDVDANAKIIDNLTNSIVNKIFLIFLKKLNRQLMKMMKNRSELLNLCLKKNN